MTNFPTYEVGSSDFEGIILIPIRTPSRPDRMTEVSIGSFGTALDAGREAQRSSEGHPWIVVERKIVMASLGEMRRE